METLESQVGQAGAVAPNEQSWLYGKWVTQPMQERSERTFFRILDVTEALLAERAWEDVTVQGIVLAADTSVGAFYNRFEDKEAVLHCLEERLGLECGRLFDGLILELVRCRELLDDSVGLAVSAFIRFCRARAPLLRALDVKRRISQSGSVAEDVQGYTPDDAMAVTPSALIDDALVILARYLADQSEIPQSDANVLSYALQQTFRITCDILLYDQHALGASKLHRSLTQHFAAALAVD